MSAPGWIILDFTAVTGLDSSAADAFVKLLRHLQPDEIRAVFAGMRPNVARLWHSALTSDVRPLAFDDLDLAMEWCEAELLRHVDAESKSAATIEEWLLMQVGPSAAAIVGQHLQRVTLDTGDVLCAVGEPSDRMFIIHSGRVAVIIGEEDSQRIMSVGSFATIGELGLYRHSLRTATVVAEVPTVAYELSRDALDTIESHDPAAATAFHAAIIRGLGDRMEYQNGLLMTLLK
jgi:SulP family sulfate permease